nr:energy transducer TonB [Paludibacter sp. 221]
MFGTGSSTEGSGANVGETQQGNPVGKGSSDGNSWSLDGRALIGKLITPTYNNNVEGVITVTIRVDENGSVTSASIGTPTTISDAETRKATLEAARKTKFSAGRNIAAGTITYNFKLK